MKIETRHTVWTLGCLVLCALILAACGPGQPTPTPTPTPGPGAGFMPDEPFGITFASHWGRDNQVRRDPVIAVQVGASWDRWPFPWDKAEPNADGHFEWEVGVGDDNVDFARSPRPRGRLKRNLARKHALGDEGCEPLNRMRHSPHSNLA